MPFLGAHESVSGGLHEAFGRIESVGGESLQIFTRNQRQWRPKPLGDEEIRLFKESAQRYAGMIVAAHASYLINLASGKDDVWRRSIDALSDECRRCDQLGLPYVVLHPGSHGGSGLEFGVESVAAALDDAIEQVEPEVMILLETTAGQGTGLGYRFSELGNIRSLSRYPESIGVCFDTCHVFAAGYDFRDEAGYRATMAEFDRDIGLQHLHFFHLNDSKKELGSRVDRHEHIGQGCIGLSGFSHLLNDQRFSRHAMTLETPKGDDLREDAENLALLRGLLTSS